MAAIETLSRVFAQKSSQTGDQPLIGVFGNGPDPMLIEASGCTYSDTKSLPDASIGKKSEAIAPYIEPFMDAHAAVFLHRLSRGDFSHFATLIFPRSDASAYTAYLYANEFKHLKLLCEPPKLFLWNFNPLSSPASQRFNELQIATLFRHLQTVGGHIPTNEDLEEARTVSLRRQHLLEALRARCHTEAISGADAFKWRNAGRYLPIETHADLLEAAIVEIDELPERTSGHRIGLVGTMCDAVETYNAIERFGTIVCDLQPFGEIWPCPQDQAATAPLAETRSLADRRSAMLTRLAAARCSLVVAQHDENDDSFGWEIPSLGSALASTGVRLINLGFTPMRPDADWLERAATLMKKLQEPANA